MLVPTCSSPRQPCPRRTTSLATYCLLLASGLALGACREPTGPDPDGAGLHRGAAVDVATGQNAPQNPSRIPAPRDSAAGSAGAPRMDKGFWW